MPSIFDRHICSEVRKRRIHEMQAKEVGYMIQYLLHHRLNDEQCHKHICYDKNIIICDATCLVSFFFFSHHDGIAKENLETKKIAKTLIAQKGTFLSQATIRIPITVFSFLQQATIRIKIIDELVSYIASLIQTRAQSLYFLLPLMNLLSLLEAQRK
ncbi:hypothetical protein ACJX0J_036185, partial [Zea mays]